ncbi:hypothetical protein [Hyphomicrobium sulfonivorans]|uniref:hypothetical protein n=1 Tax=Hyphomicrobium sulfonivorans TaxID=121290 RepID=UPI00156FF97F|nr:hypothetical protein [Hyphomicrobium sulfonivorans]MBI1650126.1 hypothetical protein [Hyphomicrobium sulfonivorans]NSL73041.1 hypothetical protein [Hyphomicrobium sulfonivorans]
MTLRDLISSHETALDAYIAAIDANAGERRQRAAGKARDKALAALALYRPASPSEARRKRKYLDGLDLHGDDLFSRIIVSELCSVAKPVATVAEMFKAFGGIRAVSDWSGESAEEIKRWKRWGFVPQSLHHRMEQELISRGYALSPKVFDLPAG